MPAYSTAEDRQLLALLAAGVKDETIGRQLGFSVRTMRRRVRRLLDLLGAQLGRLHCAVIPEASGGRFETRIERNEAPTGIYTGQGPV